VAQSANDEALLEAIQQFKKDVLGVKKSQPPSAVKRRRPS